MKTYKRVLTIAGSDSGGGAGIQADIKTISACGCYAMSAITAITVQNTLGVTNVYDIPTKIVKGQIVAVLDDIGTDAIKIGMLSNSELILNIKTALVKYNYKNIVLDPVMISTSGHKLIEDDAIESLKQELLYYARIITPNIPEAETLLNEKIKSQEDLPRFAKKLSYAKYILNKDSQKRVSVLLKAGHLTDENINDIFYNAESDEIIELKSKRLATPNTHGTGCTLSSAVASFLALGHSMNQAVKLAKDYINKALISGSNYKIGNGHGPVDHFFNLH